MAVCPNCGEIKSSAAAQCLHCNRNQLPQLAPLVADEEDLSLSTETVKVLPYSSNRSQPAHKSPAHKSPAHKSPDHKSPDHRSPVQDQPTDAADPRYSTLGFEQREIIQQVELRSEVNDLDLNPFKGHLMGPSLHQETQPFDQQSYSETLDFDDDHTEIHDSIGSIPAVSLEPDEDAQDFGSTIDFDIDDLEWEGETEEQFSGEVEEISLREIEPVSDRELNVLVPPNQSLIPPVPTRSTRESAVSAEPRTKSPTQLWSLNDSHTPRILKLAHAECAIGLVNAQLMAVEHQGQLSQHFFSIKRPSSKGLSSTTATMSDVQLIPGKVHCWIRVIDPTLLRRHDVISVGTKRLKLDAFRSNQKDLSGFQLVDLGEEDESLGRYPLRVGITRIGRALTELSFFGDPCLNRVHAAVTVNESGVTLQDLDSMNGTWLAVRQPRTFSGGYLRVGGSVFFLKI